MPVVNSVDDELAAVNVRVIGSLRLVQVSYPVDYNFLPEKVPELAQCLLLTKFSLQKR